jgi:hypothetical protein
MPKIETKKPKYEYQILMNKKIVWHGVNAKKKLAELVKRHPKAAIGIKWIPKEGVLVATAHFPL